MSHTTDQRLAKTSRLLLVIVVAASAAYVSIGVSLTLTLAWQKPEAALAWWPWGGRPNAALANRLLAQPEPGASNLTASGAMARIALKREPLNVEAINALAIIAAYRGDEHAAGQLFDASEKRSRRHIPTQIWLIEDAVRRNNIPSALQHYDRALRTSKGAADFLLPTLVAASDDPEILPALTKILTPRPEWWPQFLTLAIKDVQHPHTLMALGRSLRLRLSNEEEAAFIQQILRRMVAENQYRFAYAYYAEAAGGDAARPEPIRDGDFSGEGSQLPFDWWLRDEYELSAGREVFGDNTRLVLRSSGRGGEVARQLLILEPGSYRLQGQIGSTGTRLAVQPLVEIRCDKGKEPLIRRLLPASDSSGVAIDMPFAVPPNCGGQWLRIILSASERTEAWIDSLQITPR
ncbi:hypothetical protein ABS767_02645 [Sphingomonas sp. ST-64]|uniref:Tetratricopeptide repeat protein n=1 Tax=Sphingomonas plantiphila TaxID=3163295 RepID=A0ABW8YKW4_9SPHN